MSTFSLGVKARELLSAARLVATPHRERIKEADERLAALQKMGLSYEGSQRALKDHELFTAVHSDALRVQFSKRQTALNEVHQKALIQLADNRPASLQRLQASYPPNAGRIAQVSMLCAGAPASELCALARDAARTNDGAGAFIIRRAIEAYVKEPHSGRPTEQLKADERFLADALFELDSMYQERYSEAVADLIAVQWIMMESKIGGTSDDEFSGMRKDPLRFLTESRTARTYESIDLSREMVSENMAQSMLVHVGALKVDDDVRAQLPSIAVRIPRRPLEGLGRGLSIVRPASDPERPERGRYPFEPIQVPGITEPAPAA